MTGAAGGAGAGGAGAGGAGRLARGGPAPLLVLAPHPDDDVLGCARLMRRVADAGGAVIVAWLTDGGASHGPLAPAARAALVARRRGEALAGLRALGVVPAAVYFLGHPDGHLATRMRAARARLARICRRHAVATVAVTAASDGHPDHRAAHAIARRLAVPHRLAYPVSGRYDGAAFTPPPGALRIAPRPGDRKRAALACHRSQIEGARWPLARATIARFCAEAEVFIPERRHGHAR